LKVGEKSIADDKVLLRSERHEGDFIVIFQVTNDGRTGDEHKAGSIFDIDIIQENITLEPKVKVADALLNTFVKANAIADDLFFGTLKPDFIKRFDPVY